MKPIEKKHIKLRTILVGFIFSIFLFVNILPVGGVLTPTIYE